MPSGVSFDDDRRDEQPADSVDVYSDASTPSATIDDFLQTNNLGLGNYQSESELYQQVGRFHDGMFSQAAFSETVVRKAINETKREIALNGSAFFDERQMEPVTVEGWHELGPDQQQTRSRREFVDDVGDDVWRRMTEAQRREAVEAVTGIDSDWTPPHLRILMAQHEMSRSRGARLLDNLFGRIEKLVTKKEGGGGWLRRND